MWERTLTVGSAGKSFAATGWRVGTFDLLEREYWVDTKPSGTSRRLADRTRRAHPRYPSSLNPYHLLHQLSSPGSRRRGSRAGQGEEVLRGPDRGVPSAKRRPLFLL